MPNDQNPNKATTNQPKEIVMQLIGSSTHLRYPENIQSIHRVGGKGNCAPHLKSKKTERSAMPTSDGHFVPRTHFRIS